MIYYKCKYSAILNDNSFPYGKRIILKGSIFTEEQMQSGKLNYDYFDKVIRDESEVVKLTDKDLFLREDFIKLKFVEIDADGVLLQTHTYMNNFLQQYYQGFDGERDIYSWGMRELDELNPELRPAIIRLFNDAFFMGSIPFYSCADAAMSLIIKSCIKAGNIVPIIHTHCSTAVAKSRYDYLYSWLVNCKFPAALIVDTDEHKISLPGNILMTIEDNVTNLKNSNAKYKCLVSRGHNRFASPQDLIDETDDENTMYYVGKHFNVMTFAILLSGIVFGGM